jgi:hypothetical protein
MVLKLLQNQRIVNSDSLKKTNLHSWSRTGSFMASYLILCLKIRELGFLQNCSLESLESSDIHGGLLSVPVFNNCPTVIENYISCSYTM